MKLYSYFRSSCSYRVRIALALKELDYEYVSVELLAGEQDQPSFRRQNPAGHVPLLEVTDDNGKTHRISESLAICEYLEERFPDRPLLPADLLERALARQIAHGIASGIQPLQNLRTMRRLTDAGVDAAAWSKRWISEGLAAIEAVVGVSAGTYCVGDNVSLADICLIPQVLNAHRYQIDMASYPTIERIDASCRALAAFQRAHPDQQPDAP